ncbi:hypothetical protein NDU88_002089 [Pleurodeles waltl]|uniref:Uncharacterized protein n=1 Tax=Pleurodeles waltl TaxID=8319 RepID=A0AAV7LBJ8_PLEWA|nr:hypothetical protein NDU88_002089 [Pleurodeles waltl]
MATQLLGQPACGKRLPVRVGAPSGHRIEERVKPGAVRLTSRDVSGPGVGVQDICPGTEVVLSPSRGAGFAMEQIEEELLDYDEEEEVQEVERGHQRAVQTDGTLEIPQLVNKKAVQIDRPVGRHHQELVAGNLPRGEEYGTKPIKVGCSKVGFDGVMTISGKDMDSQTVIGHGNDGIDALNQVGIGSEVVAGKSEAKYVPGVTNDIGDALVFNGRDSVGWHRERMHRRQRSPGSCGR